jgi:hypothetical protein
MYTRANCEKKNGRRNEDIFALPRGDLCVQSLRKSIYFYLFLWAFIFSLFSSMKWLMLYYSLDGWILTLSNSAEKGAILFFPPFFLTVAATQEALWMRLIFCPFCFCRMLLNKAEKGVNIFFVGEYLVRWYSRNLRPSYPLVFLFFFVYFPFFLLFFLFNPC